MTILMQSIPLLFIFAFTIYSQPVTNTTTKPKDCIVSVNQSCQPDDTVEVNMPVASSSLECNLDQTMLDEIHSYQDVVHRIIELFMTGEYKGKTFDLLAQLTDTFGHRQTGSQALEDAIDWVVNQARGEGFNAYTEKVMAPHWVRNKESLRMTSPRIQDMPLLGLGSSIATPEEGISAQVLVVTSFQDLQSYGAAVAGKIIVYDVPFTSYGETVQYRTKGVSEAAKMGAVASLVRSVTDFSLNTPHTGSQYYGSNVKKIPGAAISVEDSAMLHRMQKRGDHIVLNLTMGAETLPDTATRNTIIDIAGSEKPEEVVVVSGHLDSWDVGTGAMDDAGGCTISWMAGKAIKNLNLSPRRTFRTIMFTNEEHGKSGSKAYFDGHRADKANFQLMMESDLGTFYPRGIEFSGNNDSTCIMQKIVSLTKEIGTTELASPSKIPDLGAFRNVGVPTGSLKNDNENYFWYHHSDGDRIDVYDPDTLDRVAALWTAVSYVVSDVSFRLPHDISNEIEG